VNYPPRLYEAYQHGEKRAYTEGFQFPLPDDDTGDRDGATLG
jgi:hypothetical protein